MAVKKLIGYYEAKDPEELVYIKTGLFHVYVNNWWVVDNNGWPLFYYRWKGAPPSPQCNESQRVTTLLVQRTPQYHVKQIPLVFVPHSCQV